MACLLYVFIVLFMSEFVISDQRMCADPKCEEPISEARVYVRYVADNKEKISLKIGQVVTVYGKDVGKDKSLWEVEVDGKRGYAPPKILKETRTFHKVLRSAVPKHLQSSSAPTGPDKNTSEENLLSAPSISDSFDVVDGTTIYANPTGDMLETQPIKTIAVNSLETDDIQSSRTIDATSISKNELDEPNSSLILPQPTTSNLPLYSASSGNSLSNVQGEALHEDSPKKSLVRSEIEGSQKSETNLDERGTNILSGSEALSKLSDAHRTDSKECNKENTSEEKDGCTKFEQDDLKVFENENVGENEDEGEDDDEIENEEEVEDDGETEEDEGEDEGEIQSDLEVDLGNEKNYKGKENAYNGSVSREVLENVDGEHGFTSSAEIVDDKSIKDVETSGEKSVQKEPESIESEGNDKLQRVEHSFGIVTSEQEFSSIETNSALHSSSTTDVINEMSQSTDNTISGKEQELDQNLETSGEENVEISGERAVSSHNMISETYIQDFEAISNSDHTEDTDIVGTENSLEEKAVDSNGETFIPSPELPSIGKRNEIVPEYNKQEIESNKVHEDGVASTDVNNVVNPDDAEKVSVEKDFSELPKQNTDEYPSEVYTSSAQLVSASIEEHSESQDDDEQYGGNQQNGHFSESEENVDESGLDGMDTLEVQGTCDMQSSDCPSETEDLPQQMSSVKEAERGWFTSLTERTTVDPNFVMGKEMQKNSLLFLIVTAITVIIFSLGYYYIEKRRRDGSYIAKIHKLEKALMISRQEKFELKDELENLSVLHTTSDAREAFNDLREEYEECKITRAELEDQVTTLEKELEAATEAGLELNRMMSELLSAQHGSDTLMKSVEHLQKQLDNQQSTITTMNACLTAKNLENENLQSELNVSLEHVQNLEEQLSKMNELLLNLQKEKSEVEHDFRMKNQSIESQLVEALESKSADSQRLCRELDALQEVLDETRKTLSAREGEVSVLQECLSHAECLSSGGQPNISLETLLDIGHLRAKIGTVTKERDEIQEKLQGEEDARKLLEDHMKIVSEEVSTLRAKYEEADRGKMEAQTRLEVLSNYFKEKETQLQKELGLQEAMYIQKEGDSLSTIEQIKAFQEEIENYKAQNDILKREIVDQERSMKAQISVLEKKAHENWVIARQTERRLEESKQEATQLRNRLTLSGRRLVGTIPGPDVGKPPERGSLDFEHNGEMSSSPAHMGERQEMTSSPLHFGLTASPPLLHSGGQPLPPGPFPNMPLFLPPGAPGMPFPMPPPPGVFPDDFRPPPLGRMSSPPPEPHGSFSPFDHSPPMSPLIGRPYRPPIHYEDSPNRYRHHTPPSSGAPSFSGSLPPGKWEDRSEPPRSSFRPLHKDPSREPKGSTLSSGHSSESLDKGSRHRVSQ